MGDQEDDQKSSPGRPKPATPNIGDLFWIGTACAISVVGGLGLGYLVDSLVNTTPLFTFIFLAFGIISAVLLAVHQLRQYV
jgi:F0F1-type ATP synthase assembly protein I